MYHTNTILSSIWKARQRRTYHRIIGAIWVPKPNRGAKAPTALARVIREARKGRGGRRLAAGRAKQTLGGGALMSFAGEQGLAGAVAPNDHIHRLG